MSRLLRLPFLPGSFVIEPGSIADYHALARFHYRPGRPATVAGIWRVRYIHGDRRKTEQIAAVGVLSWPVPCVRERNLAFGLLGRRYGQKIAFANANLRTISRVIVHPVFRATGLATRLVRQMIAECPTPYIEALASMGWVHRFFDRAGMTRVEPDDPSRPVYYYAPSKARTPTSPETPPIRDRNGTFSRRSGTVPGRFSAPCPDPIRTLPKPAGGDLTSGPPGL